MGQTERRHADARRFLEIMPSGEGNFWVYQFRRAAYQVLGQPREDAAELLALHRTETLRPWSSMVEEQIEAWGDAPETFCLAMMYSKLGQTEDARRLYDKAVERIDKNTPEDDTLRRYHDEAAALLDIPINRPTQLENSEEKPPAESGQ